jgi:hypothetical protein
MEALLARRERFEGPEPALEYYRGAAGPKREIRGTRARTPIIWRRCWPVITIRGANTHEENIEAVSIKNQKLFSDEQALLARKAQMKHQMKNEFTQKDIMCPRAIQREQRDFEENSIPQGS